MVDGGKVVGAVGLNMETGEAVKISAKAVILAAGGLTRLYRRNSASVNMGGDSYALALRAGADLVDMEFVQFFPIGHLAPRMVGMDPIMWDPFRYKLGGRLLNSEGEEFVHKYGHAEVTDKYTAPRDVASFAILQEVAAGRGSPAGGAFLSFQHIPEAELRAAFGPVIDRLAANGIDLTKGDIEVSPIAHYHMGGVRVDTRMETAVPGLFAAGEAVGGANGEQIGCPATPFRKPSSLASGRAGLLPSWPGVSAVGPKAAAAAALEEISASRDVAAARSGPGLAGLLVELQEMMWRDVGLLRTQAQLDSALERVQEMRREIGDNPSESDHRYALSMQDWFDMRNSLLVAETIILGAQRRTESRGAHQRDDYPRTDPKQAFNFVTTLKDGALSLERTPIVQKSYELMPLEAAE